MSLLAIIDTETTGLESSDMVIELGLVLFDTKSMTSIIQIDTLIWRNKENSAEFVNKISRDALNTAHKLECYTLALENFIRESANSADYVIAHNAEFDKKYSPEITTPWLCTQKDFRFPLNSYQGSLIQLANDYQVPIFNNHRALNDCNLIASIFQKFSSDELEQLIEIAAELGETVIALCSFQQKDLAKSLGFKWDRDVKRCWSKVIKQSEFKKLEQDCKELGFDCHFV